MSAELDALQKRLEGHFEALSVARRERGLPVFALEHGLDATELSGRRRFGAELALERATQQRRC